MKLTMVTTVNIYVVNLRDPMNDLNLFVVNEYSYKLLKDKVHRRVGVYTPDSRLTPSSSLIGIKCILIKRSFRLTQSQTIILNTKLFREVAGRSSIFYPYCSLNVMQ